MRALSQAIVLMGSCLLPAACMAPTSEESEPGDEAAIGSVHQALTAGAIRVMDNFWGEGELMCPAGHPYALSGGTGICGGGACSLDIHQMAFESNDGDPVGIYAINNELDDFNIMAVCSDYAPYKTQTSDSDGDRTLNCPANYVAVGGAGYCEDSGAHLIRSRPNPDTAGSEPTGWRATCVTPGEAAGHSPMQLSVTCALKGSAWNWNGCKTRKRSESFPPGYASVWCNSGETAVATGGYCGSGGYIEWMGVFSSLAQADVQCSEDDSATAYAVCCPNVDAD